MINSPDIERIISFESVPSSFPIAGGTHRAPIHVSGEDFPGVLRAVADLSRDIETVTGQDAPIVQDGALTRQCIIIGTIDKNNTIATLVSDKKIDISAITDKKEAFIITVLDSPFQGVDKALVVAGTDKRGTIFGAYHLSEAIGVSPWYWWADATPKKRDALFALEGVTITRWPTVALRGIFLNDEYPSLTRWVAEKYGMVPVREGVPPPNDSAAYNSEMYKHIFELILRLGGNYLWPAMWNNAFNEDDPDNARLAHEYGIVMGTSHQEPMIRAQKEWDRRYGKTLGHWNYRKHSAELKRFWEEGVARNAAYESMVTIGLRGADDTAMDERSIEENMSMLEEIVREQRKIIEKVHGSADAVPQLWCLYKEAQDYYDNGLTVPDDVTLLWSDDNWGNIRRLPTDGESARKGGAGIYYHFDYHGGPRSYQWLNTSPIAKIRDQMGLAAQYGADKVWIVNVGCLRGYEFPLEYFMYLAWNTAQREKMSTAEYARLWAEKEFGREVAEKTARIISGYSRINGRCKPELLSPETYSLTLWREAETVCAEYASLLDEAERILGTLEHYQTDAWKQLVYLPVKACAIVHELYMSAGKNRLFAKQGRKSARVMKERTQALFNEDRALMKYWNEEYRQGAWNHFMDQTHIGYKAWNDPEHDSLDAISFLEPVSSHAWAMGVAVEGYTETADCAPTELEPTELEPAKLCFESAVPGKDAYIEIFSRSPTTLPFTVSADKSWIRLSLKSGDCGKEDIRVTVTVDYNSVPAGGDTGYIEVSGAGTVVRIAVEAIITAHTAQGAFIETDGIVSIESASWSRNIPNTDNTARWTHLEEYGRTSSGMRAETTRRLDSLTPGKTSAVMEYDYTLQKSGERYISFKWGPSLNIMPHRPVRFAWSVDGETPKEEVFLPKGYKAENGNTDWEESVMLSLRNKTVQTQPLGEGLHTLRVWLVDPGIVLEKIIISRDLSDTSRLGPPESPKA